MNKVILMGRLTADPEIKQTQSGKELCVFSIAVDRRFNKEETDFFRCTAWSKTGEFINRYFNKGKPILVSGRIETYKYESNRGGTRTGIDIVVDEAYFAGGQQTGGTAASRLADRVSEYQDIPDYEEVEEDDLPF